MMNSIRQIVLAIVLVGLSGDGPRAAEPPILRELRSQRVGDSTYFHVRFELPADLRVARLEPGPYTETQRRMLARQPRLVPQDAKTQAVYQRLEVPHYRPTVGFGTETRSPVPIEGLEFVGKVLGEGKAKFLLLYPNGEESAALDDKGKENGLLGKLLRRATWAEVPVELDLAASTKVPVANLPGKRKPHQAPTHDDLEGLWAEAQAAQFAVLEAQAPEFGFYGFACAATGRKYGVRDPALEGPRAPDREKLHQRLYETTTGAAAITESLQLHRLLNPGFRDRGERTIDVAKLPGIDIAEHPWKQMMGDKKPAPEPLAKLVPHDNYYIHFKNVRKFIEFGELLDQWGTNVTRAYEVNSRDYQLKERYERQICIKSTWLGKTLGPLVIRSLAVTGSDAYLREGSDLTVLFDVVNQAAFLAAVQPFIDEQRKDFGRELKESKQMYQGVTIESFVTPLREVSLHRATFESFVVYANSLTGLKRVIDTHQGRSKALAASLDFQYMRTVFRLDDEHEDGFAFLPDAFIRQLVGPASKIKEKRRLEALTSLSMVTHAAMFHAWESRPAGKLPADHAALLATSSLKQEEIYAPEGKEIAWDAMRQAAASDAYNTLHFATPLIELPMDKVTPQEEAEYRRFRAEYVQLWRRYFDPVGMRFAISDKQVRVETYILPLINSDEYRWMRQFTGNGTASLDATSFSPRTLLQYMAHIDPNLLSGMGVGDWIIIRLDDGPAFGKLMDYLVRRDLDPPKRNELWNEGARLIFQLPVTAGVHIRDQKAFAETLASAKKAADDWNITGPWEPLRPPYKGVTIGRIHCPKNSALAKELNQRSDQTPILPVLYHAIICDAWYVSLSEDAMRDLIDRSVARREGKVPANKEVVQINSSIYVAPEAAFKAGDYLRSYLEWETHKRALANNAIWYALHRCGLDSANSNASALKFFGFIPVSPDGEGYVYDLHARDLRTDEVWNQRHGSLRKPTLHSGLADTSPLATLLDQLRTLRIDLRFREDGVHTVLTLERRAGRPDR